MNPLLEELGLHELISEPPPLGLAEDADDDLDDETGEAFDERTSMSREGAVLPPLTERDVERRLKTMNARYPSPDSAADAIDNRFPGLLDLFLDVTQTMLEEDEAMFLETALVRVCHLIKPATGPAPALHSAAFSEISRENLPVSRRLCSILKKQCGLRPLDFSWPAAGGHARPQRCRSRRRAERAGQKKSAT